MNKQLALKIINNTIIIIYNSINQTSVLALSSLIAWIALISLLPSILALSSLIAWVALMTLLSWILSLSTLIGWIALIPKSSTSEVANRCNVGDDSGGINSGFSFPNRIE